MDLNEILLEVATKARAFVVRKYGEPPHGACLEASKMIARLLRKRGVEAKIVHGEFQDELDFWPHWWVRVGDLIVDVTADQFEGQEEKIVIGQASNLQRWSPGWSPSKVPVAAIQ